MKNKCLLRSHNDLTPVEDLLVHNVTYIPGFIMLHNAFIKTNNDMPSMYCLINVPSKLTGSQLQLCMCPVLIGLLKEILTALDGLLYIAHCDSNHIQTIFSRKLFPCFQCLLLFSKSYFAHNALLTEAGTMLIRLHCTDKVSIYVCRSHISVV